jgi:hypothetical protein
MAGSSVLVTEQPANLVSTPLYVCDEDGGFASDGRGSPHQRTRSSSS